MAKVRAEADSVVAKYSLAPLPAAEEWRQVCKRARVTFVTGLVMHALASATDKGSLRISVSKHLDMLAPSAEKGDLPAIVLKKAQATIRLSVGVGGDKTT